MKLGDGLGILSMIVWLSIAVGPWWAGLVILLGVTIVNTAQDNWREKQRRRAYHRAKVTEWKQFLTNT